jgi:hypothetical protein
MKRIVSTVITVIPRRISIFEGTVRLIRRFGLAIIQKRPITTVDVVYIIKLISKATVIVAVGIPLAPIKSALAGCPPVADGVIAEKNWSDAAYKSPCIGLTLMLALFKICFNANPSKAIKPSIQITVPISQPGFASFNVLNKAHMDKSLLAAKTALIVSAAIIRVINGHKALRLN